VRQAKQAKRARTARTEKLAVQDQLVNQEKLATPGKKAKKVRAAHAAPTACRAHRARARTVHRRVCLRAIE
jgi:hypothetical protein